MICMIGKSQENTDFYKIKNSIIHYIPNGIEKQFGINKLLDIDSLKVGKAISVFTLRTKDTTFSYSDIKLIPISLRDSILFFAKGLQFDDTIKVIGIGGNVFASKFNKKKELFNHIHNLAFLSIPELNKNFVFEKSEYEKNRISEIVFIPIEESCSGCFLDTERAVLIRDIISMIKNKAKRLNNDEVSTN